jgi:phage terminase small subunit
MSDELHPVELSRRRERFCREYVKDFNGKRAATEAGYSENTATVQASQLLTDLNVQARVTQLIKEREAADSVTEERIIQELERLAFGSARDHLKWDAKGVILKDSADLTAAQAAGVAEVSQGVNGIKIKMHSKEKALELLMRHKGMLADVGSEKNPLRVNTQPGTPSPTPEAAAAGYKEVLDASRAKTE